MSRKGDGDKVSGSAWVIALGRLGSWRLYISGEVRWWQLYESKGVFSREMDWKRLQARGQEAWWRIRVTDGWRMATLKGMMPETSLAIQWLRLGFHCREYGFDSLVGQLRSCMSCRVTKKKVTMRLVPVPCLLLKHPLDRKGQDLPLKKTEWASRKGFYTLKTENPPKTVSLQCTPPT